jgi:clan AA aspartic protease (TIGR02281 family)
VQITEDTPSISLITANGVIQAPLVTLNNVTIGQVRVNNIQAVVQDLGKDLMLSGLLGMNFFKGKTITINNGHLILEEQINNQQLTSR